MSLFNKGDRVIHTIINKSYNPHKIIEHRGVCTQDGNDEAKCVWVKLYKPNTSRSLLKYCSYNSLKPE